MLTFSESRDSSSVARSDRCHGLIIVAFVVVLVCPNLIEPAIAGEGVDLLLSCPLAC